MPGKRTCKTMLTLYKHNKGRCGLCVTLVKKERAISTETLHIKKWCYRKEKKREREREREGYVDDGRKTSKYRVSITILLHANSFQTAYKSITTSGFLSLGENHSFFNITLCYPNSWEKQHRSHFKNKYSYPIYLCKYT